MYTFFEKTWITVQVLYYFLDRMIVFVFLKFSRNKTLETWLNEQTSRWSKKTMKILSMDPIVIGRERVASFPKNKPVFIVSNHQSYTDIPVLFYSIDRVFGFVAKKELGNIPLLNFWMKQIGCILIDRKKASQAIRNIKKNALRGSLNPLTLFPEGTRSKDGSVGVFKPGVLKIAWALQAHIQPVVIKGTRENWENRGLKPKEVKVELMEPFTWTESCEKNFETFKLALQKSMSLTYEKL